MKTIIKLSRSELLDACLEVSEEYMNMDLKLTLRQMYYQLVSRALIENGQKSYNRVGEVLTSARYEGLFPLGRLEDRGRNTGSGDYSEDKSDLQEAIERASSYVGYIPGWVITRSRWWMQPVIISVWVEKEALAGVFQDPCKDLGVSMFACKGYPSVSALNAWLDKMITVRSLYREYDKIEPVFKVLYFGDHDPDGMEIPESAERNIRKLEDVKGIQPLHIEFERVALNKDQIRRYNPPPFDAKKTSTRYKKYLRNHNTYDAWELDALEPRVLQNLIRKNVEENFDEDLHEVLQDEIIDLRTDIKMEMCSSGFMETALRLRND